MHAFFSDILIFYLVGFFSFPAILDIVVTPAPRRCEPRLLVQMRRDGVYVTAALDE